LIGVGTIRANWQDGSFSFPVSFAGNEQTKMDLTGQEEAAWGRANDLGESPGWMGDSKMVCEWLLVGPVIAEERFGG
jgi:hypothetical protein